MLDTNLVLTYLRNNEQAKSIEEDLQLLSGRHNLIFSVVSVGELKSIAKRNRWENRRVKDMLEVLSDFLIADINNDYVIEKYAEIDTFSQCKLIGSNVNFTARNMGKNDLWIAATASVLDVPLITTDKDFEHLRDNYLKLHLINLNDYKN
jgi:tRNA(fMet)-specific endonuclease VapC